LGSRGRRGQNRCHDGRKTQAYGESVFRHVDQFRL
jgi:hypothetical protein